MTISDTDFQLPDAYFEVQRLQVDLSALDGL